jgi:hypothetical protein
MTDAELRLITDPLSRVCGNGLPARIAAVTTIRRDVYRVFLDGSPRTSVVVKCLPSSRSELERKVTGRWLPSVGLEHLGPPRLLAIGDPDGERTWHVYDDLGSHGLDQPDVSSGSIIAAMDRVAALHASFSNSAMLPEPRFAAYDMGVHYYARSVGDALRSVESLVPPAVEMSPEEVATRDAVLELLTRLADDAPRRLHLLMHEAGPETLVHGDLTRANVFVVPDGDRSLVFLIDWDRCGVAPAGFDISTHLAYYDAPQRQIVLESYTSAMAERGFTFPDDLDWQLLVQTFEAGRLANQIIWVALGIHEANGWSFAELQAWRDELAAVMSPIPAGGQAKEAV